MSSCAAFNVNFNGPASDLVTKIKQEVTSNGGTFTGDTSSGTISISISHIGSINGNYSINGQVVTITITSKPLLISCAMIEDGIKRLITGGSATLSFS